MKSVLVLCIGNSCRSQMAEGYLNFYGKGKAEYHSAGLHPGELHPLAIRVMLEDSIDISGHQTKNIETFKERHFDFVISVCSEISDQIPNFISANQLMHLHVPDPAQFVGSAKATLNEFRRVRETIKIQMLKFIGKELSERELIVQ